jgi:signal transduction histidine kinase
VQSVRAPPPWLGLLGSWRPSSGHPLTPLPRDPGGVELNAKILSSLSLWIAKTHGDAKLREIAESSGVDPTKIDGVTQWLSVDQVERFHTLARELVEDDRAFLRSCGEHFFESMGAVRFMVRALSVQQFFEAAAKASKQLLRISRFEVIESTWSSFAIRYVSDKPESRLLCLSRQAGWIYGPRMWGLPLAQLTETACIARGDHCCEYHLTWFERGRLFPILVGLAAGAMAAFLFGRFETNWVAWATLPLLGGLLADLLELRRTSRSNLAFARDVNEVLRDVSNDEVDARSEIVALHQRQREWIRLMEQQVTERTTTLEQIVEGLDGLQQSRVSTIRGFSHDLRNPLFVVRGNTQFLLERYKSGEEGDALRDMEIAAVQIETMLSKLMEVATAETGFVKLVPAPVDVAPLAETFRRRLKALVHGRDIKVSVFCTREAPERIVVDPLVFDRVVDNLLTNAAKYTDRGSILLEISGTPGGGKPMAAMNDIPVDAGFLTLKLSDTGLGIPAAEVERIFHPRPASEPSQRPNSYGIGLSSVVRLLSQIGGRLDVMSKADVGTTFWAHFPAVPPERKKVAGSEDNLESMITRVVTIRKAEGT